MNAWIIIIIIIIIIIKQLFVPAAQVWLKNATVCASGIGMALEVQTVAFYIKTYSSGTASRHHS